MTIVFLHWCLIRAVLLSRTNFQAYMASAVSNAEKKFYKIDTRRRRAKALKFKMSPIQKKTDNTNFFLKRWKHSSM
jgi:hypothetical protein